MTAFSDRARRLGLGKTERVHALNYARRARHDAYAVAIPAGCCTPAEGPSTHFEQSGRALATTDAHGDHHVLHAAALTLDQRMTDQPRPGRAIRVPERDGAAIHIQTIV